MQIIKKGRLRNQEEIMPEQLTQEQIIEAIVKLDGQIDELYLVRKALRKQLTQENKFRLEEIEAARG